MNGSPVLWCKDLRKRFKERLAVDGVGFEVAPARSVTAWRDRRLARARRDDR